MRLFLCLAALLAAPTAGAQIGIGWTDLSTGAGPAPLDADVLSLTYGPGETLFAGGAFTDDGGRPAAYLAEWTAAGWQTLGARLNGPVADTFVHDGRLYVAGAFDHAGDLVSPGLAVLNLSTRHWEPLSEPYSRDLNDVVVTPAGAVTVMAGGLVLRLYDDCRENPGAGGDPEPCWIPIGNGVAGTLRLGGRGEVLVASSSYGTSGVGVGEWLPGGAAGAGTWQPLPGGTSAEPIESATLLAVHPDGSEVAVLAETGVKVWDGASWTTAAPPPERGSLISALAYLPDGTLAAGGTFDVIGGLAAENLAAWDPLSGSWYALAEGAPFGIGRIAASAGGEVALAGPFVSAGRVGSWNVVALRDGAWQGRGSAFAVGHGSPSSGRPFSPGVAHTATGPDGAVYAVGAFRVAGQVVSDGIARRDPATGAWADIEDGLRGGDRRAGGFPGFVTVGADGAVYVGGSEFADDPAERDPDGGLNERSFYAIARRDPATGAWSRFDAGIDPQSDPVIYALALGPDGDLYAAGSLYVDGDEGVIRRPAGGGVWAGAAPYASTGDYLFGFASALAFGPDERLYATGELMLTPSGEGTRDATLVVLADGRWGVVDGSPIRIPTEVTVAPDGAVFVAGFEGAAVLRDGAWSMLPSEPWADGSAELFGPRFAVFADEAYYVGGPVAGDLERARFARMTPDGARWEVIGEAMATPGSFDVLLRPSAVGGAGEVYVTGNFHEIDGVFSPGIVAWRPNGAVAVDDAPEAGAALRLGPNPTAGAVRVAFQAPGGGAIEVFDALGRRVFERAIEGSGEAVLPAGQWAPGVYIVRLMADGHVASRTVTVVR